MRVIFRADASIEIGTGHVMRCLTLADALAGQGAECIFLCRQHAGHLIELIRERGHVALPLNRQAGTAQLPSDTASELLLAHAAWLGVSQEADAADSLAALPAGEIAWLVVDHYALDSRWESRLRPRVKNIFVLDDLADRQHDCDLLLDQTLGRNPSDYRPHLPPHAKVLCGAHYALLRTEFSEYRPQSLQRRSEGALRHILVNLGGVDKDNATGAVLEALRACDSLRDAKVTIVMGAAAPWLEDVRQRARNLPFAAEVLVGVSHMARLMADADFAIGASGATAWERCCLGLPALLISLADNQHPIAESLATAGAAKYLGRAEAVSPEAIRLAVDELIANPRKLEKMSSIALELVDGQGVARVIKCLELIH
jgi:UDP-2,4-diacetamido-2,4,6-trideoxy-beta-L-altropyranose hydrolase